MFEIPESLYKSMNSAASETMRAILEPYTEQMSRISQDFTKSFSNQLAQMASISLVTAQTRDAISKLAEEFEKLYPHLAKASQVMFDRGWWIVRCMPLMFYVNLVEREDEVTAEGLTQVIIKYANKNKCEILAKTIAKWHTPAFAERTAIFEQALWAHKRKKYALTVPALIIQVEGVIRQFVKEEDGGFTDRRFDTVRKRFEDKFKQLSDVPHGQKVSYRDVEAIMNYYNLAFLKKLYDRYDPSQHTEPVDVNRHALSHGLWLTYSTVEMSTKLFLVLDTLHAMLKQVKEDGK